MKSALGKRAVIIVVVVAVVASLIVSSFFYLNFQNSFPGKLDDMSFGDVGSDPLAALVRVAQDQNLFVKNGINLTITNYVTGPNNINATLNNEDDVGTSLEYAFVANSVLKEGNLSIIATMDKSEMVFLIARKDSGIQVIGDLKEKKIGLTLQMSSLFYLSKFLQLNRIDNEEVTLVDLPSSEYVDAFVNGTIDAFVAGKSYVQQANDRLPNATIAWFVQSDQLAYSLAFCRSDWITQHPELVNRFLRSLAQAEEYMTNNPVEAKSIIQEIYDGTNEYVAQIWSDHHFSISLDQSLVSAMEAEARWMISNKLTNQTVVPDFLDYIYLEGLTSVKPESVNVVR